MKNAIVFACIVPHGSELIEALAVSDLARMARTRDSLRQLGREMQAAAPEVLVVLTPHGIRAEGQFAVADAERMQGAVSEEEATVRLERPVHRPLARALAETARAEGLAVAQLNFATSDGPLSCLPLDWGAIVPLHFMPERPIVVVTPPRGHDFTPHLRFGAALARAASESGLRVGLIASCDWSHAHHAQGPYGFHPAAAALDAQVVECIRTGDLEALATLDPQLVEDAKPDGLWQALVLAGALPRASRHTEFLSYEVPTYFGLLCAGVTGQRA